MLESIQHLKTFVTGHAELVSASRYQTLLMLNNTINMPNGTLKRIQILKQVQDACGGSG